MHVNNITNTCGQLGKISPLKWTNKTMLTITPQKLAIHAQQTINGLAINWGIDLIANALTK